MPLLYAWARLDEHEIVFFDHDAPASSVRYALVRRGVFSWRYAGSTLNVDDVEQSILLGRFTAGHGRAEPAKQEAVVAFVAHLYQATVRYHAKLDHARQLSRIVAKARVDGTLDVDSGPTTETLYSALTVFLVSALEVGLADVFRVYRHWWFSFVPDGPARKKAIRKAVRRLVRKRRRRWSILRTLRRAGWSTAGAIEQMASLPELARVSFQDIDGKRGAKWAFSSFFGVSLAGCANALDENGWRAVRDVFGRRHFVIHSRTPLSPDRLRLQHEIETLRRYFGHVLREVTALDDLDRSLLV